MSRIGSKLVYLWIIVRQNACVRLLEVLLDHSFPTPTASIIGEITSVLQSMLGRPVFLQPDTNIVADLGLDSLAVMDFCMELEDRLDISIPLHQLADVVSVGDLAGAIAGLRN